MKHSIITIHHIHNFGSVFQAYSLCRFLEVNGYDAEIIDYQPGYYKDGRNKFKSIVGKLLNLKDHIIREKKFEDFIKKYDKLSDKRFVTLEQLEDYYKEQENVFISGGDQLWNNYHPCGNDSAYKFSFAKKGKKIAYGTSMGRNNFTDDELRKIVNEVSDFKNIMLREQSTVPMLGKYTDIPVKHVIDPVGLIDVAEFERIAVKPDIKEPYAVMYLADSGELLDRAVEILSKKLGLKIVHICGFRKKCYCDEFLKDAGPEEILGYILNAEFVLSASFHATMFSILFNKPFASLLPGTNTNARIEDILKLTGLEGRLVNDNKSLECLTENIDWQPVNEIIEKFKAESQQALKSALDNI